MLKNNQFDEWAKDYDKLIKKFTKRYPFEGYNEVLSYVHTLINITNNTKILDIGIGTGLLTHTFYKNGAQIYGVDFSNCMIDRAREKMPKANLYKHNFKNGIPKEIRNIKFDYIVSSYALHHIKNTEKIDLIIKLKDLIKETGKIIIADISFKSKIDMEQCKINAGKKWDESEFYFIGKDMVNKLKAKKINSKYIQLSSCAGVLIIQ